VQGFLIEAETADGSVNSWGLNASASFKIQVSPIQTPTSFLGYGLMESDVNPVGGVCPNHYSTAITVHAWIDGGHMLFQLQFPPYNDAGGGCLNVPGYDMVMPLWDGIAGYLEPIAWTFSIPAVSGNQKDGYVFDGADTTYDCKPNTWDITNFGPVAKCTWHVHVTATAPVP
jgi:hypothetical protein